MWPPVDFNAGPSALSWNVRSAHRSHSRNHFQGCRLKRVMCRWDHLDGIQGWIQLKPPYKIIRFGRWVQRSTHSVVTPNQIKSSLVRKFPYLLNQSPVTIWSPFPPSEFSSCLPCKGGSLQTNKCFFICLWLLVLPLFLKGILLWNAFSEHPPLPRGVMYLPRQSSFHTASSLLHRILQLFGGGDWILFSTMWPVLIRVPGTHPTIKAC